MIVRLATDDCPVKPWANGGGLTQEVAAVFDEADQLVWRVSIAEIAHDGPFSLFPGMERLHTIIGGAGLELLGEDTNLSVRPLRPLRFSGALPLSARLLDGVCRAFNVIFDPRKVMAEIEVRTGPLPIPLAAHDMIYLVAGAAVLDGDMEVSSGDVVCADQAHMLVMTSEAVALHMHLKPVSDQIFSISSAIALR